MYKLYQDSMAIVREFGKPDIFLTMTCNPEWKVIVRKISAEHQKHPDRPDIVAHVWNQKLRVLLDDLDEGVLGRLLARLYVVEFQKRGLPHAHILIVLAEEDKLRTRDLINTLVPCEIPDEVSNPDLYETVINCMMHGPCGSQNPNCICMVDGKCFKRYPKPLVEVTRANIDKYVEVQKCRPPDKLKFKNREYDNATANQWVVPYNPYLSQKYNCHINIEICTGITVVKYMYKYAYKGSDTAMLTIESVEKEREGGTRVRLEPNEIIRCLNARYISPVEACIRLIDNVVQGKSHSVVLLPAHLRAGHMVLVRVDEDSEEV
ncbi:Helitron helicase [Phytophthora megakarya]|uniref:Helitron helicase n=1 Tax=Phytophthora megakarya TaxID=4795 RepID=A0A225W2C4_9STRA|nr:Helitron helicase [Phytophthora megakarya]